MIKIPGGSWTALPVLALAGMLAGCGGDSPNGPEVSIGAELVGDWVAEPGCAPPCAFTLTWTANPNATINTVANPGVTVRIGITASGRFSLSGSAQPSTGTVRVSGNTMIVQDTRGVVDTIDYSLSGQYLNLSFRRLYSEIDFNRDGVMDPARVTAVLRRP